jgi:hypothetical protein
MTLSIIIFSMLTLSLTAFSIIILSVMALTVAKFRIIAFSIMTFSMIKMRIMIFSIKKLCIKVRACIKDSQHSSNLPGFHNKDPTDLQDGTRIPH